MTEMDWFYQQNSWWLTGEGASAPKASSGYAIMICWCDGWVKTSLPFIILPLAFGHLGWKRVHDEGKEFLMRVCLAYKFEYYLLNVTSMKWMSATHHHLHQVHKLPIHPNSLTLIPCQSFPLISNTDQIQQTKHQPIPSRRPKSLLK